MSLGIFLLVPTVWCAVVIIMSFDEETITLFMPISQREFSLLSTRTNCQSRDSWYTAQPRAVASWHYHLKRGKLIHLKTRPRWILWIMQKAADLQWLLVSVFDFTNVKHTVLVRGEGVHLPSCHHTTDTRNKLKIRLRLQRSIIKMHLYSNK